MHDDNFRYRHNYGYSYGYGYPGFYWPPSDGTNWVERIKPDIKNSHKSAKSKMIVFIIFTVIFPIMFFAGVILLVSTAEFGFNLNFLPVILIGLVGSGLSIALLIVFAIKTGKLGGIVSFINKIEAQDKINLQDLSKSKNITKEGLVRIINKLIETDNLRGYEVIKNVGIAKIELNAKERDFPQDDIKEAAPSKNTQRRYKCPNCGANITERTEKFCMYCGTRLE